MDKQVKTFSKKFEACNAFTDKKIKEPLGLHKVPEKCWEKVAVDLFGPIPLSKHIVVVQNLASEKTVIYSSI